MVTDERYILVAQVVMLENTTLVSKHLPYFSKIWDFLCLPLITLRLQDLAAAKVKMIPKKKGKGSSADYLHSQASKPQIWQL